VLESLLVRAERIGMNLKESYWGESWEVMKSRICEFGQGLEFFLSLFPSNFAGDLSFEIVIAD
jgi:hypothetical protein